MAGDRQAPSGTVFDPSPQFWIHKVERNDPPTVIGRCWFAPVAVGMTFDAVTSSLGISPRGAELPVRSLGTPGCAMATQAFNVRAQGRRLWIRAEHLR
jgi:hypothetical protein